VYSAIITEQLFWFLFIAITLSLLHMVVNWDIRTIYSVYTPRKSVGKIDGRVPAKCPSVWSTPEWPITLINSTTLFHRTAARGRQSVAANTNGPESIRLDAAPRVVPCRGCHDSLVLPTDTWSGTYWHFVAASVRLLQRTVQVMNIFIHQHMLTATNENKQHNNLN